MSGTKTRLKGAVLAAVLSVTGPVIASAETLADALASAYRTSGLLEQNRAVLRAADEDVAQAVSELRPVIGWSISANQQITSARVDGVPGRTTSRPATLTAGISAEMLLYDFGATRIGVDIAKEAVLGTRYTLLSVESSVLLRAASAFFEVRRAAEFLALRQSNVRLITQELRAARDRFEVGEVTRTDVSLAEARLAAARSALALAEGALNQAKLEYTAAVGRAPGQLVPPSGLPKLPANVNEAMLMAARQHPDVLAAQKDVTVAELSVTAVDLQLKPSISASAQYGLTENLRNSGNSHGLTLGVTASGPIYAGGRLSSLQRQSMARRDAARSNLHVVVDAAQQQAGTAYSNVLVARASREAGDEQVRAAQVAFRGVREETTLGARTTLDVLNAEQELLAARTDLLSARIDEQYYAYVLLAATGRLTARDLGLNVQIVDPAAYYNMVKDAPAGLSQRGKRLDQVLRKLGKD